MHGNFSALCQQEWDFEENQEDHTNKLLKSLITKKGGVMAPRPPPSSKALSPGARAYTHCGVAGGPVRVKEGQSYKFENYHQLAVLFYGNSQMVGSWT